MNIKLSLFSLMASMSLCSSAISVTTTPGNLATQVGENTGETDLVVKGEINACDFEFIANKMLSLTSLDLYETTIVAYSGNPILLGKTDYKANAIPEYALAGSQIQSIKLPNELQIIGDGAFSSTKLSTIIIPESVKEIGLGAFSNCDELTSVTIPANVGTLGSHAFIDCDNLAEINLEISKINASTFARCKSLNYVSANSVIEIGESAFAGCVALEEFTFAPTLKLIGNSAFQGSGLKALDFSATESLDSIGAWAFAQCKALTAAIMNDNTSNIGEGAFFDDASLVTFNLPTSCTAIPNYIFKGNISIDTTNMLNQNITAIGDYALIDLHHVTTFTLPHTLQYIGDNAFEGWTSLTQLNADGISEVPELGEKVWNEIEQSKVTLMVPKDMVDSFKATDQWKEFNVTGTSDVENVINDELTNRISAYFSGYNLIVKADSEIKQVSIFDSSARQYAIETTNSSEVVINTTDWDCPLYIVKVILADDSMATLKVARRN